MTYHLDRDGIMACPDDPLRVGDAPENKGFALIADRHYFELLDAVTAMAQGKQTSVKLFGVEHTVDDILLEIIESQPAADVLRLFMPSSAQSFAGQGMIDKWCMSMALKLAEREA